RRARMPTLSWRRARPVERLSTAVPGMPGRTKAMTDAYTPVLSDSQIVEKANQIDFGAMVTHDDFLFVIARAIERAAIEAYQRQQWISVEDRLPPDDETWVYAMHIDGVPEIVCGCLIHETRPDGAYSHWMPLPPAPDLPTSHVDNLVENPMTDLR